jgi:hypothetical protein
VKKISLEDETYWKLLDLKVRMKCRTWKELVDKLHAECEQVNR